MYFQPNSYILCAHFICGTDFTEVGWRDDQRKELCKSADGFVLISNFSLLISLLYRNLHFKSIQVSPRSVWAVNCRARPLEVSKSRTELSEIF